MDRKEVWDGVISVLRGRFTKTNGYEIHVNNAVGTITIIHRPTNKVMALTDTTGFHYDSQNRLVLPDNLLHLHEHRRRNDPAISDDFPDGYPVRKGVL